ncbi:MAG: fibronectin type III domain-containing protein [Acidimicrobiales bacterium]|nr:fibronectin type III domain-containing protein [Acidimicrobiales bacterium]
MARRGIGVVVLVAVGDVGPASAATVPTPPLGADSTQQSIGSGFDFPLGVAVDADGNVYVADTGNTRVVKVPVSGPQVVLGSGWSQPQNVAVDVAGNVYVADMVFPTVVTKVTPRPVARATGPGQVLVSWEAPLQDGGSPVTSYTVTAADASNPAAGGQTCVTAALTCTLSGMTGGHDYTFTVVATNGSGDSAASAPSATVVPLAPEVPGAPLGIATSQTTIGSGFDQPRGVAVDELGNVYVAAVASGPDGARISWAAPLTDGGSAVTGYRVTAFDSTDASHGGQTCSSTTTTTTTTTPSTTRPASSIPTSGAPRYTAAPTPVSATPTYTG